MRAVEEKGEWDGERVEGFVVRCTVAPDPPASSTTDSTAAARPPYPAGSPFFFKIKFAQPYLLYRSLREITKSLLPIVNEPSRAWAGTPWTGGEASSGGPGGAKKAFVMTAEMKAEQARKKRERDELKARKARGEPVESGKAKSKKDKASGALPGATSPVSTAPEPEQSVASSSSAPPPPPASREPVKVPPSQIRYPECTPYVFFVRRTMVTHPEWYGQFVQGKGIIHVREEFLQWLETDEGRVMLEEERGKPRWRRGEKTAAAGAGAAAEGHWGKTLLIPVAIPGCGRSPLVLISHSLRRTLIFSAPSRFCRQDGDRSRASGLLWLGPRAERRRQD